MELHQTIFKFVYTSKGFSFETVYQMPVYLRNFYIKELIKQQEYENEQIEQAKGKR